MEASNAGGELPSTKAAINSDSAATDGSHVNINKDGSGLPELPTVIASTNKLPSSAGGDIARDKRKPGSKTGAK